MIKIGVSKKIVGHLLLLIPLLAGLASSAFAQNRSGVDPSRIDSVFAKWDKPNSPGCELGVVSRGELIYQKGYGLARLDYDIPIADETVFYVGSVSKQFTAASIAILAARGEISLEDNIREYIPEIPEYEKKVTIRNLVHHTSGVRDIYGLMSLTGKSTEDIFTYEDALQLMTSSQRLNFEPGKKFLYSNGGYFLLSVIVERVSGKPLSTFAKENIFEPLGMENTHFHDDRTHQIENMAMSYQSDEVGGFELSYLPNFEQVGQGGLYTTIEDMYQWDQNFYKNSLEAPDFLEKMHNQGVLSKGDTLDYAFGLFVDHYKGLNTVGHGGSYMGYKANYLRFPKENFSVITLCNIGSVNPGALSKQVADIYLEEKTNKYLKSMTGSYINKGLDVVYDITFRDGALYLQSNGRLNAPRGRLTYTGDNTFQLGEGAGSMKVKFAGKEVEESSKSFKIGLGRVQKVLFVKRSK